MRGRLGRMGGLDRRQETESRRGIPDVVGMGVLVVASFSISRILYLLDVYYIRWEVGCQVKFLMKRGAWTVKREAYLVLRISYFVGAGVFLHQE
jgi:hypothetical protein